MKKKAKVIGEIKELQKEGNNVDKLIGGDRGAVSMDIIIGKHAEEGNILEVSLRPEDFQVLNSLKSKLRDDEKKLLEEIEQKK